MAYDDLREWIKALERAGELKRIRTEADPVLEIAEIADRVSKSGWGVADKCFGGEAGRSARPTPAGGSALLFENVKGYPESKLLINQFGSARRMQMALEVDSLDEIAERIRGFLDVKSPQGFLDKVKMLPMLADSHLLARRRRAVHYVPAGVHERSRKRRAQYRHVSHAGL